MISSTSWTLQPLAGGTNALGAINETLRRYLKAVVTKISLDEADSLIESEQKRISELEVLRELRENYFYRMFLKDHLSPEQFRQALNDSLTFQEFAARVDELSKADHLFGVVIYYGNVEDEIDGLNKAQLIPGNPPYAIEKPGS